MIGFGEATSWSVSDLGTGTINAAAFQTIENLTGGPSTDVFVFGPAGRITGTVVGGAGGDTLDLSARTTPLSIPNTTTHAITGVMAGFNTIESVLGSDVAGNAILGSAATTAWGVTATGAVSVGGVVYSGFGSVVGGTLADTLTGPNVATAWGIVAPNSGTISVAGKTVAFSGVENLTGGTAADAYVFQDAGRISGTLNGGTGLDVVELTAMTLPVDVQLGTSVTVTGIIGKTLGNEQILANAALGNRVLGANATTAWAVDVLGASWPAGSPSAASRRSWPARSSTPSPARTSPRPGPSTGPTPGTSRWQLRRWPSRVSRTSPAAPRSISSCSAAPGGSQAHSAEAPGSTSSTSPPSRFPSTCSSAAASRSAASWARR